MIQYSHISSPRCGERIKVRGNGSALTLTLSHRMGEGRGFAK